MKTENNKYPVGQQDPKIAIRYRAMALLARREHSGLELHRKLSDKFPEYCDLLEAIIATLQQDNLQSDERFAEAFVASRIRRGQGPQRIRRELQQRGVETSLAERAVRDAGIDWFSLATEVLVKKYGDTPCFDFKERAKRSKFLQYRGFNTEQIGSCFGDD